MKNFSDKIFLCYAWEDTAEVKRIVTDWENELDAQMASPDAFTIKNKFEADEKTLRQIEDASIFILFISNASKKTDYVKDFIVRAQNINKNILPVEIGKNYFPLGNSMPAEFSFRTKPYSYNDKDSRAKLLAQLKATLGINIENGDEFGSLVHIVTDMNAIVLRYGQRLETAKVNEDNKIRLKKGMHLLDFVSEDDLDIRCSMPCEVKDNEGELFLNVSLAELYRKKEEERKVAEMKAKVRMQQAEEQYRKELLEQQRAKEEEEERRIARVQKEQQEKSGMSGCAIFFIIILGIALPFTLIFTIPYLIYKYSNKK